MENAINTLRIQNFKSIKDVIMKPRRVNLIIGQPNVGKSNILEAMSLLGAPLYGEGSNLFLNDVLRYETISNLFYDNDVSLPIIVETSVGSAILMADESRPGQYRFAAVSDNWKTQYEMQNNPLGFSFLDENSRQNKFKRLAQDGPFDNKGDSTSRLLGNQEVDYFISQVDISDDGKYKEFLWRYSAKMLPKKYAYRPGQTHSKSSTLPFLQPPLGPNLLSIVQKNPALRREMAALFKPYGLSLVLRVGEQKFEIQKQVEDLVYNYPYSLIADTLQRIIFYLAAIESNKNSVLLFEEPEAHTFPIYTTMLGQKVVESSSNQFFVATHSPYLLTEIVEGLVKEDKEQELAIFLAYYEDYQTKLYQLTDEEVREIRRDAIDVFYNLSRYTPHTNPYA
jgi:AAA15 family ATPase/GTPase